MTITEAEWWAYWIVPPTTGRERYRWRYLTYRLNNRVYRARFFQWRKTR